MVRVLVAAGVGGIVVIAVAQVLPYPSDVVGAALAGAVVVLGAVVAYLIRELRDRDRRLTRIERIVDGGLHPEE
jgi:hypothetical protein